jgi:predicted nuclease of predicted toxin-antitoxin system
MQIRFHLDENVSNEITQGLRSRGIEVTTAAEAGLLEASDEDHVAFAVSEGRVIFTQDADLIRLAASGIEHMGIVYCRQQTHAHHARLSRTSCSSMRAWSLWKCEGESSSFRNVETDQR